TQKKSKSGKYNFVWVLNVLRGKAAIGVNETVKPAIPNYFDAVVTEDIFYAANKKVQDRKANKEGIKPGDNNIFSRLVECSKCGAKMFKHGHKNHKHDAWVCSGARDGGSDCGWTGLNFDRFQDSFMQFIPQYERLVQSLVEKPKEAAPSKLNEIDG